MYGAVIHGPHDIRYEKRDDPAIRDPRDAIVETVATCVCGSDLWRYRGINPTEDPAPIGHEFVGIVRDVGNEVTSVRPGQFVVGGFLYSCGTCEVCRVGQHANCLNGGGYDGCQAEYIRIPYADGTLIATPEVPSDDDLIADLLSLSDVMCTGWHAAVSAGVQPGSSAVVVGDGAVGLSGVLAAKELGAETIIAMSKYPTRQALAREFGATHIVAERGEEGIDQVRELTKGIGADCVIECVGTQDSVDQALQCARPGGQVGWVGLPHIDGINQSHMFWKNVGLRGGVAPVRAYLPELLENVWRREIRPGKVFDLTLPLSEVAHAYAAMDERRAIKTLLKP